MSLPRTFVSFSSTDIGCYHMMCAWKANEHIDFDFADFQLDEAINSQNPQYIKTVCRTKIRQSDTFILLIGSDTWLKTTFGEVRGRSRD
jgi:antiphage defense system Thoeris ThsB-like protein